MCLAIILVILVGSLIIALIAMAASAAVIILLGILLVCIIIAIYRYFQEKKEREAIEELEMHYRQMKNEVEHSDVTIEELTKQLVDLEKQHHEAILSDEDYMQAKRKLLK